MYTILDPELKVCGVLDLNGKGCKFYNDLITTRIADDQGKIWSDTLVISVPYGFRESDFMTRGYHLLKEKSDGYFYCYRIYNWVDDAVGPVHVKKATGINLLAWDLTHKIVPAQTMTAANSQQAFEYILQGSGWEIGENDFFGGTKSLEYNAGKNALYWLDQLTSSFGVEIRAYVQVYNGQIIRKLIDIVEELGEAQGYRLEYSHGLLGLTRTGDDSELYTKLYVYGGTNKDGSLASIASVNDGKPYIVDDDANDLYNNGEPYLEGYITNGAILNPGGLLTWGKEQMKKWNHPKYLYNVDVAYLGFMPNLGDHFRVVDFQMSPELTISARALQLDESEANPANNKIIVGEFVEIIAVTPADIWELQAKAAQAAQEAAKAIAYKVEAFTPDGLDFATNSETKRVIVRVFRGRDNVTSTIARDSYVWEKIKADGTHDAEWEAARIGTGNILTVGVEVAGSIIRCSVDNSLSEPILFATEEDAAYFATLPLDNPSGDVNRRVSQYAQVDVQNGHIYWSQEYSGPKKAANGNWQSFNITRTLLDGSYVDQMWIIGGGHGSNFGVEHVGSDIYIWTSMINTTKSSNGNYWGVARFKYVPNKTLKYGDASISFYDPCKGSYYRVNYDEKNGYIHLSNGAANFYVCKTADVKNNLFKPTYTMSASEAGFDGASQTFQSSCLDFPYIYFCSGDVVGEDQRVTYCVDIRSRSLVYKIVYTFDKGTINQIGIYNEPECISYYYDTNGTKWLIQGFSWGNENTEDSQRTNQLYRIAERSNG
ncbi:phage tail spike protein [Neobacillus drentensis]|uniref:phage tail spike protein n=1 Tax=Neobacillus drentensis TaxID=220684 RepID=UPI00285EE361|nr:phage tail spike protein [Neobacillus drentensis]MDR7237113.1 phage minor structural protein [Neobacillus drentensis]